MTTLTEQIEQLRLQIKEVASDEHALVKELAGTLKQADEKLLRELCDLVIYFLLGLLKMLKRFCEHR